jgi:DNA-binding transcriptional MerR regulator
VGYLTIGEVDQRLGKISTTIRRWEREGIIKAMRTSQVIEYSLKQRSTEY